MPKITLTLLFFMLQFFAIAQSPLIRTDTVKWSNGVLYSIEAINLLDSTVHVKYFDSLGRIESEGSYSIVDSVKCYECGKKYKDGKMQVVAFIYSNNRVFSDTSIKNTIRIGDWKFYKKNGNLKEIINYEPYVHLYSSVRCRGMYDKTGYGPCAGSITVGFIISKKLIFDNDEVMSEVEIYQNGLLNKIIKYDYK